MLRSCFSCQFGTPKCNLSSANGHFKCILKISYWLSTYSWKSSRRSQNVQVSNVAIWFSLKDNAEKTKASGYLGYVREERSGGECANRRTCFSGIILSKSAIQNRRIPILSGSHGTSPALPNGESECSVPSFLMTTLEREAPSNHAALRGTWAGARAGEA